MKMNAIQKIEEFVCLAELANVRQYCYDGKYYLTAG